MDTAYDSQQFQRAYEQGTPPWVIGGPQPAVVALADAGAFVGRTLDVGTGAGEHTVLLARRGIDVLGVDAAPAAVEHARRRAREEGVDAAFARADVFDLDHLGPVDTVLDSAVLHVFGPDDRRRYTDALARVLRSGGRLHVLVLATGDRHLGPSLTEQEVHTAVDPDRWALERLGADEYTGTPDDDEARRLGLPVGRPSPFPAWRATFRRR